MNFPSFVARRYTLLYCFNRSRMAIVSEMSNLVPRSHSVTFPVTEWDLGTRLGNASIQSRKQMLKYPKGRETDKMATYKSSQDVQPAITARKSSEWTDFNSIQLDFKSCALNTQPQSRPRIVIIALNIFGTFPASRVRHACTCILLGLLSLAELAVKPRTNRPFARWDGLILPPWPECC